MHRTAVIDIVGLSPHLITEADTPFLHGYVGAAAAKPVTPVLPAVTTTVQATYLTGAPPAEHGIVGNGWYARDDCEVRFWKQSNRLVQRRKVWDEARERDASRSFTVANSFWWFNMYSSADYSVTPRPMYPADGRKIPDVYTHPPQLRHVLQDRLGQFPLFNFWGPRADITSSRWIAAAAKHIEDAYRPTLHLVYLPHLDYCLQAVATEPATAIAPRLRELDDLARDLVAFLEARAVRVLLLSEYGVSPVDTPVHINRALRAAGLLAVRDELGRELLDPGASRAFAVADHQIAHVYVNDRAALPDARAALQRLPGVARVLDDDGKRRHGLHHPRAGDLVAVAEPNAWFTYYYWLDDARAPDFARCVDIHRKPGYDPVELFVDPHIMFPTLKAAWRLAQKEIGMRYLMDLIPLDATLVKGSHGHLNHDKNRGAMIVSKCADLLGDDEWVHAEHVFEIILRHLGLGKSA